MILTIIARLENVDDKVVPQLDEALARHVAKWMRFSETKLSDRLNLWVAKFDPAAVAHPTKVMRSRFVQIQPDGPGMSADLGRHPRHRAGAFAERLDALVASGMPGGSAHRRATPCGCLRGDGAAERRGWPARPSPLRCTGRDVRHLPHGACPLGRHVRGTTSCSAASKTWIDIPQLPLQSFDDLPARHFLSRRGLMPLSQGWPHPPSPAFNTHNPRGI